MFVLQVCSFSRPLLFCEFLCASRPSFLLFTFCFLFACVVTFACASVFACIFVLICFGFVLQVYSFSCPLLRILCTSRPLFLLFTFCVLFVRAVTFACAPAFTCILLGFCLCFNFALFLFCFMFFTFVFSRPLLFCEFCALLVLRFCVLRFVSCLSALLLLFVLLLLLVFLF